ncbi:MAG: hypothetical protein M3552_17055 [Planctomycetota bacterium]|nr:hypothetical protein [Planctomycetaceae bacterium]MDQ3332330.1 hypothetical protein [Planctomycetota bacterium]
MHMQWLWQNPGPMWQWAGLTATLAGAVSSLAAFVAAWMARGQAKRAYQAAVRLTRVTEITDLTAELLELEILVAHQNIRATTAKANHLRGRIARFLADAYDDLSEKEREELSLAREQLGKVPSIAAGRKQSDNKLADISIAIGAVSVSLGLVAGRRAAANREDRGSGD